MTLEGKIKRYLRWGRIAQWRHEREARKDQICLVYQHNGRHIWIRLRGFGFHTLQDFNDWEHANALCDGFKALATEFLELEQ